MQIVLSESFRVANFPIFNEHWNEERQKKNCKNANHKSTYENFTKEFIYVLIYEKQKAFYGN